MTTGRALLGAVTACFGLLVAFAGGLWTVLALGPNDDQEVTYRLDFSLPILAIGVALLVVAWRLLAGGGGEGPEPPAT